MENKKGKDYTYFKYLGYTSIVLGILLIFLGILETNNLRFIYLAFAISINAGGLFIIIDEVKKLGGLQ